MSHFILKRFLFGAVFLCVFFLTSCENEDQLGLSVQPEGREIGVFTEDSFSIEAKQVSIDSVLADQNPDSYIGAIKDAVFGHRKASLVSQVRLPSENIDLGTSFEIDSAFITFKMDGYYGDLSPVSFIVYEVDEEITSEQQYYSNYAFTKGQIIGDKLNYVPNFIDSVTVFSGKEAPQMRIPLNTSFIESLFIESNFASNEQWLDAFKGFLIEPVSVGGANEGYFLLLDRIDALSRMVVYYRNLDTDTTISVLSFPINAESNTVTILENDLTNSRAELYLQNPSFAEDELLISSGSGLAVELLFEGLEKFKSSLEVPVIVSNAILELPLTDESITEDVLRPLGQVYPSILFGERRVMTPDFSEGSSFINGRYDASTESYKVNVTRYVQWYLDDKLSNNRLLISAGGGVSVVDSLNVTSLNNAILSSSIAVGRTIVAGTRKDDTKRTKLIISYTPVNLN